MQAFLTNYKPPAKKATTETKSSREKHIPWVEKYRPKTVEQVASQDEVVAVLKKCAEGNDIPNLLFYGPPGTGKTSAALAFARDIFGKDLRNRVLELNASDERGIQVVREQVKTFASTAVNSERSDGKKCPALKLIILDEADSMTSAAQDALRRTMEKESRTTRFCLICNYISRIIGPITSRCAKFRFKQLPSGIQMDRLQEICSKENVEIDNQALTDLVEFCKGDLRKSITYLQSSASFFGAIRKGPPKSDYSFGPTAGEELMDTTPSITTEKLSELVGVIPSQLVTDLIAAICSTSHDRVDASLKVIFRQGYAANQLLEQLQDEFIVAENLTDLAKAKICDKISTVERRLLDGASEYLQILDLCYAAVTHIQKKGLKQNS